MINTDEIEIVHYCHPHCEPFMNICRLPEEQAFSLASQLAAQNADTTAFFRFADFKNYYPKRMKQDAYLYERFLSLGGKPKETHPLSFVLCGSAYLDDWFGNGIVKKIKLKDIPSVCVSFTLGDSMSAYDRDGGLTMYTKETLSDVLQRYPGTLADFMREVEEKYRYVEVQLWDDEYCKK